MTPVDEWEDYDVEAPDDPDAFRDMLDDPAREDFA
jgi:hypothetical protein